MMKRCRSPRRNAFYSRIAGQTAPRVPKAYLQWAAIALLAGSSKAVYSQTETYDPNLTGPGTGVPQDGAGTWDGATADWYNAAVGTAGGSDVVWPNDGTTIAQFGAPFGTAGTGGAAGAVNIGEGISAGGLILNQPAAGNYTLNSGVNNISLGASGLIVNGGNPTVALSASSTLTNSGLTTIGNSNFASTNLTLSGGTWSTSPSGTTSFTVGSGSNATLQMSTLSNFVFSNPTSGAEFDVGVKANGVASVTLANTSSITAAVVRVGDSEGTTGSAFTSTLNLGSGSTTIDAGVINIGGGDITGKGFIGVAGTPPAQIASGIVQFAGAGGSLTVGPLAGASGTLALGPYINIGVGGSGSTSVTGTLNLNGHNVNINAAGFNLANRISGSVGNSASGVLSFDTGTINVGSVYMSHVQGSGAGGSSTSTLNIGSSAASTELFDVNGSSYVTNDNVFQFGNASTTSSTAYTSTAVVNINGGTALINSNMYASHSGSLNSTHSTVNLQGGTLNMNRNEIGGTGDFVTFNATSGTLENVGAINRSSGASAGLVKTGSGILTLSVAPVVTSTGTIAGSNTWTGQTTINGGTLVAGAANAMAPLASINVANGTLDMSGFPQATGAVTVGANGVLDLGIGNLITANGAANFNGTLNIVGTPSGSAITLMSYTSETGSFANATPFPGYTLAYTPTALELLQGSLNVTWNNTGGSGNGQTWDASSQNWNNGAAPATYADGDFVTFNDNNNATANGGSNPNAYNVTLNTTVSPASFSVNNSSGNYTFTGAGSIAGSAGLVKNGTGSLAFSTNNTYTGTNTINSGTVVVNTSGNLGAPANPLVLGTPVPAIGGTTTPVGNLTLNTSLTVGSFSSTTSNATADIITIAPSATFTDNGAFVVGGINNAGSSTIVYNGSLTATGGGALSVAGAGNFLIGQTSNNTSGKDTTTADFSGLNSININTTGAVGVGLGINSAGILNLADTTVASVAPSNSINAADIEVGNSQNNNDGGMSTLSLGSGTNILQANTINIGIGKTGGVVTFAADATAASSVTITGTGGGSALANITVGENTASTYTLGRVAQLLLAGHNANVQTNTLMVGEASGTPTINASNGTVTFDTGTFTSNWVQIATYASGTSTTGPTGSIIVGGASPNTSSTGVFTVGGPGNQGVFNLGVFTANVAATETANFVINSGVVNMFANIIVYNTSSTGITNSTLTLAGNGVLNMEGFRIGGNSGSGDEPITNVNFAPNASDTPTLENLGTGVNGAGLVMNGQGTLVLKATNTYSGGTTVNSGTLLVGTTGALPNDDTVNVNGGTLRLGTSTGLATLASLTVNGSGTFDVNNNHVIINYGGGTDPVASIAALLAAGYNGGAWNGPGGITSSAAAGNPGYTLGYADAADTGNPAGLASGTMEVAFTLIGDADLNHTVNGIDFGILAANFNKTVSRWDQGDFDYNGIVNGIDFTALAANFNKAASSASDLAALDAFAAANGLLADVPEPATAALAVAGLGILARRRRRN
jgi:autotransporter-associated beta strand protein